jgi:hypothetical protein
MTCMGIGSSGCVFAMPEYGRYVKPAARRPPPQTQAKIERYPRTMKNGVKLQHYYFARERALTGTAIGQPRA